MRKRLREDPLAILKVIVARHNGRASTVAIKNALLQVGIEGSAWSGWWRKARKLAEGSAWFKVTGSAAKGEIQLLHMATDPVEDLRRQLAHSPSLADLLTRVRDHLPGSKGDERMRSMMLDLLVQRAAGAQEPAPVRLAAWMLLREERDETPPALVELLRKAVEAPAPSDPTKPPALWVLFHSLGGARDQERCVGSLQAVSALRRFLCTVTGRMNAGGLPLGDGRRRMVRDDVCICWHRRLTSSSCAADRGPRCS